MKFWQHKPYKWSRLKSTLSSFRPRLHAALCKSARHLSIWYKPYYPVPSRQLQSSFCSIALKERANARKHFLGKVTVAAFDSFFFWLWGKASLAAFFQASGSCSQQPLIRFFYRTLLHQCDSASAIISTSRAVKGCGSLTSGLPL